MIYKVTLNDTCYEVDLEEGGAQIIGRTAAVADKPASPPAGAPAAAASEGAHAVNAPMPGVILGVDVSVGQSVSKGQVLLTLEAMKMENEIVAPCAGVVAQIAVAKDTAIETGALLLTLSPD